MTGSIRTVRTSRPKMNARLARLRRVREQRAARRRPATRVHPSANPSAYAARRAASTTRACSSTQTNLPRISVIGLSASRMITRSGRSSLSLCGSTSTSSRWNSPSPPQPPTPAASIEKAANTNPTHLLQMLCAQRRPSAPGSRRWRAEVGTTADDAYRHGDHHCRLGRRQAIGVGVTSRAVRRCARGAVATLSVSGEAGELINA